MSEEKMSTGNDLNPVWALLAKWRKSQENTGGLQFASGIFKRFADELESALHKLPIAIPKGVLAPDEEIKGLKLLMEHYEELVSHGHPNTSHSDVHVLFEAYETFLRQLRLIVMGECADKTPVGEQREALAQGLTSGCASSVPFLDAEMIREAVEDWDCGFEEMAQRLNKKLLEGRTNANGDRADRSTREPGL